MPKQLFQFLFVLLAFSQISCSPKKAAVDSFSNPPGYDLSKFTLVKLPLDLDEISGLSFYEKDSSVFAISDDRGAIFKIKPNQHIIKWKFSHGADFEDITRIDSTFYVLQSNGDIFKVRYDSNKAITRAIKFNLSNNNEFESFYYDDSLKKIILICKDCEIDKKNNLSTFSFDPTSDSFSPISYRIDIASVYENMDLKVSRFKPSAAAINPVNGMLYIISSINKMILVTDRNGIVHGAYPIDPTLFKQPEGIAFRKNGDMIISNEFAEDGTANLLLFKYQQ